MEIHEIKSLLSMSTVLHYYGLKTDKHSKLNCPFHEDKTPSMQVYYKTQTAYCFSSNCKTHGKSIDVIDFILYKENRTKHEAINKAIEMIGNNPKNPKTEIKIPKPINMQDKIQFLEKMFTGFRKGIFNSIPAKEYCKSRNLNHDKLEIGFNGGQFHHGTRKNEELIQKCLEYGLLLDNNLTAKTGDKAYSVFGNKGIVFPLKNAANQIVSFYFRSTINNDNAKHYYLKNRSGLYPNYPNPTTQKLILTEAIIDCASLLQIEEITKSYSLLACYGTNGLTQEHLEVIKKLPDLEEIIFAFDNDEAGNEAVLKYANQLIIDNEKLRITTLELPNNDINETLQGHENEIIIELLNQRKEVNFLFCSASSLSLGSNENLNEKLLKTEDMDGIKPIPEGKNIREIIASNRQPKAGNPEATTFLKSPDLLQNFGIKIGEIGIIGEERNRLLMLVSATTYKMYYNLHVLYQGSSGSGKTHTIQQIASLIPPEDSIYLTRVTDSSLYNFKNDQFMYKLIVFEDMDGLKEGALMAVREMISNKRLSSSTSVKDKRGNSDGRIKAIEVSFSSLSATTKGELYEDNMSRIIVLSVDESAAQTQRIIDYKNKMYQGEIDRKEQEKTRHFLRECIRLLQPYEVINPFAGKIQLPDNVHKPTRMHDLVMGVINQITIINQYQRQQKNGFLIAEKEDVINGLKLMKESIILKMDELEGKIRTFYEELKKYVETKAKKEQKKTDEIKFTRFDIKDEFLLSKAQINKYLYELFYSEYITKVGKHGKGNQYRIMHWDNFRTISEEQIQAMMARL